MQANDVQPALPLRSHTILGVCEGIAEDFGFNPVFLRVPFAAVVLFSPLAAIGGYLALGLLVLASRWLFPNPRVMPIAVSGTEMAGAQPDAANDGRAEGNFRAAA